MDTIYKSGLIEVTDDKGVIGLFYDGKCQGRARIRNGKVEPVSPYMIAVERLIGNLAGKRALVIGGGACIIPSMLHAKGFTVDIVEPNYKMFDIAENYFGYEKNGVHHVMKGEDFLDEYFEKFDAIFLDAFTGFQRAISIYNLKAYMQFKNMSPNVFINLIAETTEEIDFHKQRIMSVFPEVRYVKISELKPYQTLFYGKT